MKPSDLTAIWTQGYSTLTLNQFAGFRRVLLPVPQSPEWLDALELGPRVRAALTPSWYTEEEK